MTGYPQPQHPGQQAQPMPGSPAGGPPVGYGPSGPADDHTFAMLSYLLAIFAHVIAPLVIYLIKMNESGYVRYHAAQALNLNLTALAYSLGSIMVSLFFGVITNCAGFVLIFPLLIAIWAGELVFLILAAMASNRGELYRIPTAACLPLVH
jgi:uncharacterized Tic20 family protein